jgi:hypothetical protein
MAVGSPIHGMGAGRPAELALPRSPRLADLRAALRHRRGAARAAGELGLTSLLDYVADLEKGLRSPENRSSSAIQWRADRLMLCRAPARAGVLLTPGPPASVVAIRPSTCCLRPHPDELGLVAQAASRDLPGAVAHFNTTDAREGSTAWLVHDLRALFGTLPPRQPKGHGDRSAGDRAPLFRPPPRPADAARRGASCRATLHVSTTSNIPARATGAWPAWLGTHRRRHGGG